MALTFTKTKGEVDPDAPKTYAYEAVDATGKRVKRKMTAPRAAAVSAALQQEGYIPLSIKEVATGGLNVDISSWATDRPLKMGHSDLANFARRFHQLLKAGLSVPKAVMAVGEEQDPKMVAMTQDIGEKTAAGIPLSQAFSDHPGAFDDVFVSYISAGEETGELVGTTSRLAKMLEKRSQLALKIKSVTAYPKMVSLAIGVIVFFIVALMVPRFAKLYDGFGAQLPLPTRVLVAVSKLMIPVGWWSPFDGFLQVFGLPYPKLISPTLYLILIFLAVRYWLKLTSDDLDLGEKLDRLRFRMPIFGRLNAYLAQFRWSSTLGGALSSGMQLIPALDLASRASGARWYMKVNDDLKDAVRTGRPLSEAMAEHRDLFPPDIRAMIRTGEESGEISDMLDSVSNATDSEIDAIVAGLGAKIEVALLLVMGVVVGGLLVVLYLPIINLASTAGSGLSGGTF